MRQLNFSHCHATVRGLRVSTVLNFFQLFPGATCPPYGQNATVEKLNFATVELSPIKKPGFVAPVPSQKVIFDLDNEIIKRYDKQIDGFQTEIIKKYS